MCHGRARSAKQSWGVPSGSEPWFPIWAELYLHVLLLESSFLITNPSKSLILCSGYHDGVDFHQLKHRVCFHIHRLQASYTQRDTEFRQVLTPHQLIVQNARDCLGAAPSAVPSMNTFRSIELSSIRRQIHGCLLEKNPACELNIQNSRKFC